VKLDRQIFRGGELIGLSRAAASSKPDQRRPPIHTRAKMNEDEHPVDAPFRRGFGGAVTS
jgi:hypothetical protein